MKTKNNLIALICLQVNLKAQVSYQGNPNFTRGVKKSYEISSLPSSDQGTRVSFLAADFIQFNPGFEVNLGTDLEAGIIECD